MFLLYTLKLSGNAKTKYYDNKIRDKKLTTTFIKRVRSFCDDVVNKNIKYIYLLLNVDLAIIIDCYKISYSEKNCRFIEMFYL